MWTCTADRSKKAGARPAGEYKIQRILPGQGTKDRGSLVTGGGHTTLLLGYCPDIGVYVAWEAAANATFGYSASVQTRDYLLLEGQHHGWAAGRRSPTTAESCVAFAPWNLRHYLRLAKMADQKGLSGDALIGYYRTRAPFGPRSDDLEVDPDEELSKVGRKKVMATRLARDPVFASKVKAQFHQACAACGLQLGMVEAAHIIPVAHPEGVDDVWNGIALCPNHHRAFDANLMVVEPDLRVYLDADRVALLEESGFGEGLDGIRPSWKKLIAPAFWADPTRLADRKNMKRALRRRGDLAAG